MMVFQRSQLFPARHGQQINSPNRNRAWDIPPITVGVPKLKETDGYNLLFV
jgi:hypothetical protein